MERGEDYEIIYEEGVPVIAFQICSEDENTTANVGNEESDSYVNVNTDRDTDSEENQTLQYFHEDEKQKVSPKPPTTHKTKTLTQRTKHITQNHPASIKNEKAYCMEDNSPEDKNLKFVIVKNATKCNSKKLYDVNGYSYTLRNVSVREGSSFWRCRFKINQDKKECGAKVKVTSDEDFVVLKDHRHSPDPSISFSSLIKTGVEPSKPKHPKPISKPMNKYVQKSSKNVKKLHHHPKSQVNRRKYSEEHEEILDYFSEGRTLEGEEDLTNLLEEQTAIEEAPEREVESVVCYENTSPSPTETEIAYKVIKNGSLTGTHILYDSLGYSYSVQERKGPKINWSCQAVLSADGRDCGAKVSQVGPNFIPFGEHSHKPKRHSLLKINKMEIFSSQKKMSPEHSVKRKGYHKEDLLLKKVKNEKSSGDKKESLTVNSIKSEKEESFNFVSKDISFTVSLDGEEGEEEELPEDEEALLGGSTQQMEDQKVDIKRPRKRKKTSSLGGESIPKCFDEDVFSELRHLAHLSVSNSPSEDIKYLVIKNGSGQGGPKLFDSRGYFYTIRTVPSSNIEDTTSWFCCFRAEGFHCRAKVSQKSSDFTVERDHCHPPNKDKFIRSIIRMEAVELIKDPANLRRSGMSIVKGIMDNYPPDIPININVDHLVRFVNYQKKSFMENNDISNCRYSFNKKKIPKNFLLDKIVAENKFHLTFATEIQLAYLAAATEWYVDEADFNVAPFTNLFSIHVYVHSLQLEQPHQIPVFFAFISERREKDYTPVFSSIKSALNSPPAVTSVVIDLNIPLRRSLLKNFPNAEIKCCDRHWSEDISSKLREIDLSSFFEDPEAMNYLYQLPLLNLLPRQDFETALAKVEKEVEDDSVQDLICYIRETFGERSLWAPKYWSSFKMPIHINNHEQWRADILDDNEELEIYSFIRTLYLLSKSTGDNLRLMSKKKIKKHFLSRPDSTLCKVYLEWKRYCKGEIDCHKLLENLASIIHIF